MSFGTTNSEMPLTPPAPLDARQREMHDVRREIVLAIGNEDLLAEQPEVVALGHRAHAHLCEVRAGCGSVRFMVPVHSPLISFGRYVCC
jgi:hypothetical protein